MIGRRFDMARRQLLPDPAFTRLVQRIEADNVRLILTRSATARIAPI
jgi:hypothetical protein